VSATARNDSRLAPFASPLAALLLAGSAAISVPVASAQDPAARDRVAVHVVSHGWHTGIVIPLDREAIELCPPLDDFRAHRFVELGWGDEGFYRSKSISVATTVRAIGWPTPSVIHAVGFDLSPEFAFPGADVIRISLSRDELRRLIEEIAGRFADPHAIGPGIYGDSRFYRAHGSYYFPNTCNVWTLRTLAVAGVRTTPLLGIRAESTMAQLARSGTAVRLEPREAKWPYALATACGIAIAISRRRARARREPPPARDADLRHSWLAFLAASSATLFMVVLSANHHGWASLGSRISIGAIVAALGAIAVISIARLRARLRLREAASALLALLGCAIVLSPL
jgi:uncharacterized protein (TIGR02117 family)